MNENATIVLLMVLTWSVGLTLVYAGVFLAYQNWVSEAPTVKEQRMEPCENTVFGSSPEGGMAPRY